MQVMWFNLNCLTSNQITFESIKELSISENKIQIHIVEKRNEQERFKKKAIVRLLL